MDPMTYSMLSKARECMNITVNFLNKTEAFFQAFIEKITSTMVTIK